MTKNYIFFDDASWLHLLPLTFTRPVSEIRIGILTLREKWERRLKVSFSNLTQPYLSEKYPLHKGNWNILISSAVSPSDSLVEEIDQLKPGEYLADGDNTIALFSELSHLDEVIAAGFKTSIRKQVQSAFFRLRSPWEIYQHNGTELTADFRLITAGRKSCSISKTNNLLNPDNIFAEEGARLEFVTLNAATGPVYLGKDTEIMEGSVIRGPFALCDHSQVKMGAKIYGPTTIGPYSKAGGEINNSVFIGFSNKAHDGFLGNSVIGEWCNIGADTNSSNLKNNYLPVRQWSYVTEKFEDTGMQFCGLTLGDHSKCGINTMFNTGTVVGVSANIFGPGYPRNFIPSFSWGGPAGYAVYPLPKALDTAERVMDRRGLPLNASDKKIFGHIFEITKKFRNF
jgi:UDP-N-acetylglucosamine diphosphorylase/glucosamine-1-phosphate N-acetyltransferase